MTKQYAKFKNIKNGTSFHTKRDANNGCEADSLEFCKVTKGNSTAWSYEFGHTTVHPDQVCWFRT
jgi:hypothetical protein